MKITLSWLKDFIDFNELDAAKIAERLTLVGVEVDSLESQGDISDQVVVAKITSKSKHPNADTLSLCKVTDGQEDYDIVCGATNMKEGDHVALAKIGARLPGDFKIKKSKIRGEVSFGMLCSTKELGMGEDADGILILEPGHQLGEPLKNALALGDTVFDIEITPNRGDLLSAVGLARELAAVGMGKSKIEFAKSALEKKAKKLTGKTSVKLDMQAPDSCARYMLQEMEISAMPPTPQWMVSRLEAVGLRSINTIVDITNYVLLEWGQPLHAFDLDELASPKIIVRQANKGGESIKCLDEQEYKLDSDNLAICDDNGPVCIAGVMGGFNSGVSEKTKRILLESACFDASSVRRTAKKLGLSSDSSFRFERGVDPNVTHLALARAVQLIEDLVGGRIVGGVIEVNNIKKSNALWQQPIKFRAERFAAIIGETLEPKVLFGYLEALGCTVGSVKNGNGNVTPPSWRHDLSREIDLIEECMRLHGLDAVEATLPKDAPDKLLMEVGGERLEPKLRGYLQASGFYETKSLSFVS
jgi:phenylalanyl-tRNA synthetase beta chain